MSLAWLKLILMRQSLIPDVPSDLPLTPKFQFTLKGKCSFYMTSLIVFNHLRNRNSYLALIFQYLLTSVQNGSQAEGITSGPKLLYFFPNRNLFIYSFPVSPACKRRINLGRMILREKKKRIKTEINLRNPRSECYQKVNLKNISLPCLIWAHA